MTLYVKYDKKPPHLPVAVAESMSELAKKTGMTPSTLYSCFYHGYSNYAKIEVEYEDR